MLHRRLLPVLLTVVPTLAPAQRAPAPLQTDALRRHLAAIAHDSMGGRPSDSRGNRLTAEYVAAEFRRFGLEPGGDEGTFFQTIPMYRVPPDSAQRARGGRGRLILRRDTVPPGAAPAAHPVRNVIGIVRGTDPALRHTFVAISAHNDHVGTTPRVVDHDSLRAFNRVVRPSGADSRMRPATPEELARIGAIRDSLRAARGGAHADSVFNGADDDGSGTVALIEIARSLMSGPRPRRSIVLISHGAEEIGLVGSRWFTEHPTLPLDSFVGEIDVDMIGRGGAADVAGGGGGPGYIEVVGSRRLSAEFGALLEAVNGRLPQPFAFNYEFDAPGHPAQYYCRADHYSYARFGIPSVSLSTGLHLDYHQLTDEPQYIDYDKLARVATLARDFALAVANLAQRPPLSGPRTDPRAPCRQ
jgi:hypothetical protein